MGKARPERIIPASTPPAPGPESPAEPRPAAGEEANGAPEPAAGPAPSPSEDRAPDIKAQAERAPEPEPGREDTPPKQQDSPPSPPDPPRARPDARARLILRHVAVPGTNTVAVKAPAVIGRSDVETGPVDVDLGRMPNPAYISRKHARLECPDGLQWILHDLDSRNGSYVRRRGEARQRVNGTFRLHDGDEIQIGEVYLEFHGGA